MTKFVFLILTCTQGIVLTKSELFATMIGNMMECVGESSNDMFSLQTCQEMMRPGNDNSLAKYNECKCIGACSARKMELLTEGSRGEIDAEKFRDYAASIGSETVWIEEANVILDKCKTIKNVDNDCEYIFQWTMCGLSSSEKAMELLKLFMESHRRSEE